MIARLINRLGHHALPVFWSLYLAGLCLVVLAFWPTAARCAELAPAPGMVCTWQSPHAGLVRVRLVAPIALITGPGWWIDDHPALPSVWILPAGQLSGCTA